jgi:hypothetical protein
MEQLGNNVLRGTFSDMPLDGNKEEWKGTFCFVGLVSNVISVGEMSRACSRHRRD